MNEDCHNTNTNRKINFSLADNKSIIDDDYNVYLSDIKKTLIGYYSIEDLIKNDMDSVVKSIKSQINLQEVYNDCQYSIGLLGKYRLFNSSKFLSEILLSLSPSSLEEYNQIYIANISNISKNYEQININSNSLHINHILNYSSSLLHLKEYKKCFSYLEPHLSLLNQDIFYLYIESKLYHLQSSSSSKEDILLDQFLSSTSSYSFSQQNNQSGKLQCKESFPIKPSISTQKEVTLLINQVISSFNEDEMNPFLMYLLSKMYLLLNKPESAKAILIKCLNVFPFIWSAWEDLISLLSLHDYDFFINSLSFSWMKFFFLIDFISKFSNFNQLDIVGSHLLSIFNNNFFILNSLALSQYNQKQLKQAKEKWDFLFQIDPFRYESIDHYSNLLFLIQDIVELDSLAKRIYENDRFRPESLFVIANFFAYNSEHEKAIEYFEKAIASRPNYLLSWILLGQEYFELKDISNSIAAYRVGLEINKNESAIWSSLGQIYELHSMFSYALYYNTNAIRLKPFDSKVWSSLGFNYEKMEKYSLALECYEKGLIFGDVDNICLIKMGVLNEGVDDEKSRKYYEDLLSKENIWKIKDKNMYFDIRFFLGKHYLNKYLNGEGKEGEEDLIKLSKSNLISILDDSENISYDKIREVKELFSRIENEVIMRK